MMAHLPGSIAVHPMSPGHSLKDRGTSARRPTAITGELSSNSDQPTSAAAAETLPSGGQSPAGGSKGEGSMSKSGMEPQLSSLLAPIQDGLLDMVHDFRVNGLKPLVLGSQVKEGGTRRKRGPSLMTRLKTMAGHEGGQHEECPGQQLSRKGGHPPREGGNRTQHTLTAHLHACLQNLGKHYRSVAVPTTPHTRCCHFVVEEGEAAALAFCHHAGYAIVGAHCQRLQELSKRRARLLFSRDYVQALTSASLYVRHVSGLLSADRDLLCDLRGRCHSGSIATSQHQLPPLKSTCSELQDLCKSWSGLYQRVRSGPAFGENAWTHGAHLPGVAQSSTRDLRTQQRSCFNRSSLPLLALQGVSCMEQLLCIRLCLLARHPDLVPKSDICQAIVMFNKTLAEFQTSDCAKCCIYPKIDACAFPSGLAVKVVSMEKVLKIVANERAVSVAHTLCSAFSPDQEWDVSLGKVANADDDFLAQIGLLPGSDVPVGSTDEGLTPGQAPPKDKLKDKTASIVCILRQLCSAEDGFMKTILAVCLSNVSLPEENAVLQQETCIVGQSYLSHRLSDYIEQGSERCLAERLRVDGETPRIPGPPAAMFSETTSWARWYQRRLWRGVSSRLLGRLFLPTHACDGGAHRGLGPLGFHPYPVVMALVEDLRKAGAQECLPLECQQQVRAASSHLHAWLVMRSWDAVFCQALSSASRDRCAPCADEGACMTTTARLFHQSLLPLQSLLASCHGTTLLPSANSPIARCAMEQGLATLQAAFHWLSTKSFHFLASWSLEEVFLVTQGDLRVFLEASSAFLLLAKAASVSAGSDGRQRDARSALTLLENTALQLQALSEETLRLFASDCKKMAQETLEQTMPLGKQWRLAKELAARPTEPNEYALVAVATVVQPVMEALAPLETHCQAEPAAQRAGRASAEDGFPGAALLRGLRVVPPGTGDTPPSPRPQRFPPCGGGGALPAQAAPPPAQPAGAGEGPAEQLVQQGVGGQQLPQPREPGLPVHQLQGAPSRGAPGPRRVGGECEAVPARPSEAGQGSRLRHQQRHGTRWGGREVLPVRQRGHGTLPPGRRPTRRRRRRYRQGPRARDVRRRAARREPRFRDRGGDRARQDHLAPAGRDGRVSAGGVAGLEAARWGQAVALPTAALLDQRTGAMKAMELRCRRSFSRGFSIARTCAV
ncbi:uncharacterized protein LOC144935003 isoform X1 [Lampetra fluviatilis]